MYFRHVSGIILDTYNINICYKPISGLNTEKEEEYKYTQMAKSKKFYNKNSIYV
jgi:hypothetical protein